MSIVAAIFRSGEMLTTRASLEASISRRVIDDVIDFDPDSRCEAGPLFEISARTPTHRGPRVGDDDALIAGKKSHRFAKVRREFVRVGSRSPQKRDADDHRQ
jgi:hypothetical protein